MVQWDEARKGYAIWDTVAGMWAAGQAVFGQERVARGIADDLNERDRRGANPAAGSGGTR